MPLWPMDNIDRVLVAKIRGQHTLPFQYAQPMSTLLALEHSEVSEQKTDKDDRDTLFYIAIILISIAVVRWCKC